MKKIICLDLLLKIEMNKNKNFYKEYNNQNNNQSNQMTQYKKKILLNYKIFMNIQLKKKKKLIYYVNNKKVLIIQELKSNKKKLKILKINIFNIYYYIINSI